MWQRLLAALGLSPAARRADAKAAHCVAGSVGEQRTAALLQPLEAAGWLVLHDRAIPGARRANADHVLVSPGGQLFLVDSKLWSGRYPVYERGGTLWHGSADRGQSVRSVLYEADLVARAVGAAVQPVIAMHNAPVAGHGFFVQDVPVVPAARLVEVLRGNDGPRNRVAAAALGWRAAAVLPPHLG
ncbi:NERD domain-containing protein (plasmid) [Streptomyces sp. NEAU-sy36]|uniref:nuclease-related domain-containing protein n=1 Tax=unclassified Streptomyces TaxID=2593676 RepID=UPI0015D59208|nr:MULTISPECIES: nuclease-related domain-containing protein [unclassified Streptomyces]QLJ06800.1 NERD domain-containing protein [Streptomyces sp. NEAU-sy36]